MVRKKDHAGLVLKGEVFFGGFEVHWLWSKAFLVVGDGKGRWRQSAHEANEGLTNKNPENGFEFGRNFRLIDQSLNIP